MPECSLSRLLGPEQVGPADRGAAASWGKDRDQRWSGALESLFLCVCAALSGGPGVWNETRPTVAVAEGCYVLRIYKPAHSCPENS